jgi:short-subunit dehydrogenase
VNVLVIGATSTIAECLARLFARESAHLYLLARDPTRLQAMGGDLLARGAGRVETACFDAAHLETLESVLDSAWNAMGTIDVAVVCHGTLTDQDKAEQSTTYAAREFTINGASATLLITALGARFAAQKQGSLAVLGSVAGDRGRASNYLYAAAKSAVAVCAEGLRAKLYRQGVSVLTVKPGYVRTAMTADLALPGPLVASADRVARDIYRAIKRGKSGVLYTPWFWRWIMVVIRLIPQAIFVRLSL